MDNDRENRFLLDTSIIVPIAIAGAVAVLIVAFVYCCRQFALSKLHRHNAIIERNSTAVSNSRMNNEREAVHQSRQGGGLSSIISTAMTGYLPRNGSTRTQYPHPSHINRTTYHSTQVSFFLAQGLALFCS